ncbi:MAG TPA: DUF2383 domain-containing protein [Nannocystis sp.]|jgi:hypothetical protein
MPLSKATLDALISQCQGEIAAVDAYDRALKKFAGQPEEPTLAELRVEHEDSITRLRKLIENDGGKIPHESGAWGSIANAVHTLTAMVNDEVPLQVLQKGEQIGVDGYERALADTELPQEARQELTQLLARCRQHLERLQYLRDHILETPTRPMTAW